MTQHTEYGFNIQKLYIEMMLADSASFVRCQSIFDHTLFDRKLQVPAEFLARYVEAYNVLPTYDIINSATGSNFKQPENLKDANFDWLLDEFEKFTRHKGLERAILESADDLEKGELGQVEERVKKAVQIGLQKDLGTDYFANPRERLMKIKDNNGQMSCGWKALDDLLYGGLNRGEISIFAAQSGGGKSIFLANLGVNYSLAGMNVLYITLELSEELVSMRIDSMMTDTSTREVFKKIDDVELKVKMLGKKSGSLQVKYMPSGKTANDIRAYIKEYEVKTGKKIDVLLVDYLDLLMPNGKKISAENLFIKDKYVSEELRNLAMEKQLVLITAAQLNRCLSLDTLVEVNGNKITIDKVQVGDYLTSNAGPVEVLEVLPITKRPVFEITTKSGKKIKCSAQHKFPTKDGLKTIETGLMAFDTLFTTDAEDMIYSIEYIGMEDTLDINVSGNRLFYANDILTHNCAVDEVEFDHSHISGGLSKIQTADNVFGIFTSRAMRERGMYQVQCMKTRNSSGVGQKIDLAFDVDTLRITDVDDSGGYQPSQSPGSAILSSIRQRSTVEDNEPKVKAEVQSSKIRDLLNNLPKN
jgi:archaellum biogenesis ATPase FlaH